MPRESASAPPFTSHNFRVSIGSGKGALQLGFMRVEFPSFVLPGMKLAEPDAALAARPVGMTLQIDEGAEVFDFRHSSLHPLFAVPPP